MLAERFILRTDQEGHLTGLPTFAANEELEVIVLRKDALSVVPPTPYHLEPSAMGLPRFGVDLTKALRLADELHDEALVGRL